MLFESSAERSFAGVMSRLSHCNPFLPERIEYEREALGEQFVMMDIVWNVGADWDGNRPNIGKLRERAEAVVDGVRVRLAAGVRGSNQELQLYEDLAVYVLYYGIQEWLREYVKGTKPAPKQDVATLFRRFVIDFRRLLEVPDVAMPSGYEAAHLFACFFQVRRAFHYVFRHIVGASMPAAKLRAAVWQSIFTHDMNRYRRLMFDRMADITTLITGPSGTGKELVARAIALSRYIPLDPKTKTFAAQSEELFHPLNLSALSPTLIESELFGHQRGAFTGALEDRTGWMEVCHPLGSVFLDEIGDLDPAIQVKLLRVLQTRSFQRLGDTRTREFRGKIVAATNRNLVERMNQGSFREDFYYRLCSDLVTTPSLHEQLAACPEDLHGMVLFITRRLAGDEADALAEEVESWIHNHLGDEYAWPGNFRELEQCVRNVLIRKEYVPPTRASADAGTLLARELEAGSLTADELLRRYCSLVYSRTKNFEETARRLKLDRRTVKAKVDESLLNDKDGIGLRTLAIKNDEL
ncbi:MAG TPA: sigma 54-interacting transcriptional regulator [Tepidisphaeraceae bacterium]|jgi:transcriptional regulator with AAA-type ATPase domain